MNESKDLLKGLRGYKLVAFRADSSSVYLEFQRGKKKVEFDIEPLREWALPVTTRYL